MIKEGEYLGYGFIEKEVQINHVEELEDFLIPQKNNRDIQKILRPYIVTI
ncbi:hypothetical protein [Winogradskyella undariae]|nr:hypothetical protein [Winogradskyella undariae]